MTSAQQMQFVALERRVHACAAGYKGGTWRKQLGGSQPAPPEILVAVDRALAALEGKLSISDANLAPLIFAPLAARPLLAAMLDDPALALAQPGGAPALAQPAIVARSVLLLKWLGGHWIKQSLPQLRVCPGVASLSELARGLAAERGLRQRVGDLTGAVHDLTAEELSAPDGVLPALLWLAQEVAREAGIELPLVLAPSEPGLLDAVPCRVGAGEPGKMLAWRRFLTEVFREASKHAGPEGLEWTCYTKEFQRRFGVGGVTDRGPAGIVML